MPAGSACRLHREAAGRVLVRRTEAKGPGYADQQFASKAINRFFKRYGITTCFHELRDTWIEEARHSPIEKEIWEIISGHSRLTVSDLYGGKKPNVLLAANEKICEFLTNDTEVKAAMLALVAA